MHGKRTRKKSSYDYRDPFLRTLQLIFICFIVFVSSVVYF